jgi:hypothetical protein
MNKNTYMLNEVINICLTLNETDPLITGYTDLHRRTDLMHTSRV